MEKAKYLIFLDVDGTLVRQACNTMSENTINVFEKLKKQGHIFIIATGRAVGGVHKLKGSESVDYIAALFGNVIYNCHKDSLERQPEVMDSDMVRALGKDLEDAGFEWTYKDPFEQKTIYHNPILLERYVLRFIEKEELESDLDKNLVCQLLIDGLIPQEIIDKYSDKLDFYKMPAKYYDVTLKGSSKDKVVDYFKKKYPGYTAVAIGDAANDIDMFRAADISISMGNASDEIKALTDYTTKSVDEDGVAYALTDILKL